MIAEHTGASVQTELATDGAYFRGLDQPRVRDCH
jgi:hypothetical protein